MRVYRIVSALIVLALLTGAASAGQLIFHDAWSPLAPPGRMMAGFVQIQNQGEAPVVLVDGHSEQFGRIEIHTMDMEDGVMRMRRLDQLSIAPGETVELAPGGLHLMLIQPLRQFEIGQVIDLELIDASGQRWPLQAEVRERRHRR